MDNKKIGNFLSECRKDIGITQQQLAEKIGVSNKAISKWETGEGYPDITTIPELCHALGISTDDFFAGERTKCMDQCTDNSLGKHKNHSNNIGVLESVIMQLKDIRGKTIPKFPYILSIMILYYLIPYYLRAFPGEVVCAWLFVGIPFLCMISGGLYAHKRGLSVLYCFAAGLPIIPSLLALGGGEILIVITVCGYIAAAFLGGIISLAIKSKYDIFLHIEKKKPAAIYGISHISSEDLEN